jgi:hypothetical protein
MIQGSGQHQTAYVGVDAARIFNFDEHFSLYVIDPRAIYMLKAGRVASTGFSLIKPSALSLRKTPFVGTVKFVATF